MSNWNYTREETPKMGAGDYRFEVASAEETVSKSGNKMIVVGLKPNGASFTINDYFVEGKWFNSKMTQFFDGTNIEENNFELLTWIGAMGAARFKEDENGYLKVHYYLKPEQAEKLPEWQGEKPERQTVTDFQTIDEDDDLPF